MSDPLGAADRATIARAQMSFILAILAGFKGAARPSWLSPGHTHPDGNLPSRVSDFNALPPQDIIEVIAVRGPLHTIDGWSYFSRSLSALLSGDPHAARHLAYYAELRAALSILASGGIGVFNRINRVVDAGGNLLPLSPRSTHDMCWAVLEHWATLPDSLRTMLRAVKINGVALMESLEAYFPSPSAPSLGGRLIREWGFDLQQGAADSDERNYSSYQPNELAPLHTSLVDDIDFVNALWKSFEPNGWKLEPHLLRKLLELEQATVGGAGLADRSEGYARLDGRVTAVVTAGFISRSEDAENHPLLVVASDRTSPASPYSMIARAALLLRISTSMVEANFESVSVTPFVDLKSWWRNFGVNHGFWTPPIEPESMQDLWLEVDDALSNANAARATHRHEWVGNLVGSSSRIAEAERIALWNICR